MVKCACHTHALELMCDDWEKDCIPLIYVGIWTHGQRPMPLRWSDRFRWIYYLLKDGRLHGDDVVLNEKDAREVSVFLREKSDLIERRIKELNEKKQTKKTVPMLDM